MNRFLSSLALVAALALTACGGGGGESTNSGAPSSGGGTDSGSPLPGTPMASDPVAMVSTATPVGGVIPAGHARNVRATYHGPATHGELLEISVNFAELTYTWTVVQSSFDIESQSQSGTLAPNPNGAGYLMTSSTGQAAGSLLITSSGSLFVSGFALVIEGQPVSQALFAQPRTDKVITLADIVGTYTFGQFDHEPGERYPFGPGTAAVKWGVAQINSNGRMDICYGASSFGACTLNKRREVTFGSTNCPAGLVAVSEFSTFIGCMVVSSNGREPVLHLDMQTSDVQMPGAAFFVRQPDARYTLSDGSYSSVVVANLVPDTSGCSSRPFVVDGTMLTATCGEEGATQQAAFFINTAAPLPSNVIGLIDDEDKLNVMLLPIADGMWISVSPTLGWAGDNEQKRGNIRVLVRR